MGTGQEIPDQFKGLFSGNDIDQIRSFPGIARCLGKHFPAGDSNDGALAEFPLKCGSAAGFVLQKRLGIPLSLVMPDVGFFEGKSGAGALNDVSARLHFNVAEPDPRKGFRNDAPDDLIG